MSKRVTVRVPATTANLGPGFDCLGVALGVYNEVTTERVESCEQTDSFIQCVADAYFAAMGRERFAFRVGIAGHVPCSRGLGSSVTVRLGLLMGLNELAGGALSREEVLRICVELEGHPDNAVPAAIGGFVLCRPDGKTVRFAVEEQLSFVLLIPSTEMETARARAVVPATVERKDAIINIANTAGIVAAFATGDYQSLNGCFEDRLHQPYRAALLPSLFDVIQAGTKAGALGGWLRGSGSTIACLTLKNPELVGEAMKHAFEASGASVERVVITRADNVGAQII